MATLRGVCIRISTIPSRIRQKLAGLRTLRLQLKLCIGVKNSAYTVLRTICPWLVAYLLLEERSVVASLDLLRDVVASLSSLFLVSTAAWYSRHGTKFTPVVPGAGHMHF